MIKKEVMLKVAEAFQQDVGYGRARIDNQTRMELDLAIGDVIAIVGPKVTSSVVWRAHPTDEGKRIIRIDNLTRKNAGTALGDNVSIRKADVQPAEKVILAPLISKGQQIQFGTGIETLIKKGLLKLIQIIRFLRIFMDYWTQIFKMKQGLQTPVQEQHLKLNSN